MTKWQVFCLSDFQKLDDKHYFDPFDLIIYNEKFDIIFNFPFGSSPQILIEEKLIIFNYNREYYGAVDFDGKVVIPFKYKNIDPVFFNGKTLAWDSNYDFCFIGLDGSVDPLTDNYNPTYNLYGILFSETDLDRYKTGIQFNIIDYDSKVLYEGSSVDAVNVPLAEIQNIFGRYTFFRYMDAITSKYVYFAFDKTLRN